MFGQAEVLQIELSSMCNALCLGCHRTEVYNFNESKKTIPKKQIVEVDTFKKLLESDTMSTLTELEFCGTIDDPLMHPQFLDFLNVASNHNPKLITSVHTNGSLRSPEYFKKVGNALKKFKYHSLHFSIDGLEDTNHIYRQNTDYNKIIENAKAAIETGAHVRWQFLIFPWNSHQQDEAEELAKSMGFSKFEKRYDLSHITETETVETINSKKKLNLPYHNKQWPKDYSEKETRTVNCRSLERKMYFMGYDSKIWPCCFLHNGYFMRHNMFDHLTARINKNYGDTFNSLLHNNMDEIVQHEFFQNDLVASFDNKVGEGKCDKIKRCADVCTKKRVIKV